MRKFKLFNITLLAGVLSASLTSCGDDPKTIKVCASEIPHAQVLNNIVKSELEKDGWKLQVKVLDWTLQNDAVANKEYDANYFQHVPYLETYTGKTELFAAVKVHYEPLGIYVGKAKEGSSVSSGKSFAICDDVTNGVRALQLLEAKNVISKSTEGDNFPFTDAGEFASTLTSKSYWTSKTGNLTITKIAEENLVESMPDYDFACLPCNTAFTGRVPSSKRVEVEDDPAQVAGKANIIAARKEDYAKNEAYKAKIDALCNVMLSEAVSNYFNEAYLGAMTCDASTQIDLR